MLVILVLTSSINSTTFDSCMGLGKNIYRTNYRYHPKKSHSTWVDSIGGVHDLIRESKTLRRLAFRLVHSACKGTVDNQIRSSVRPKTSCPPHPYSHEEGYESPAFALSCRARPTGDNIIRHSQSILYCEECKVT